MPDVATGQRVMRRRHTGRLIAIVVLAAALAIIASTLQGAAAPMGTSLTPHQRLKHSATTLHVKLKRPSAISPSATAFRPDTGSNAHLDALLNAHGDVGEISKLYRTTGRRRIDVSLGAALGNYYVIRFNQDVDMQKLVRELDESGLVDSAYPAVAPAPLPATPSFTQLQTYRDPAPAGTNSAYASSVRGGTGDKVKLVDIEYSWNFDHEDLASARGALVPNGTPVDPFNDHNHGTAVLGEISADKNSFGVTGAAYGVSLAVVNADNVEHGYDLVGALTTAASITQPGDVIQIEQQTTGPDPSRSDNYVPMEWLPEVYDAIRSLTGSGRIVVEAAGNGYQNLDDTTLYGTRFPMGKPDSGAIIVGAGEHCDGPYPLSRVDFSDYGARVNLQGPGNCVATTGYNDLYSAGGINYWYTDRFNGTSSATPIVAAAAASLSSAFKAFNNNAVLSPERVRTLLIQNSTPQNTSTGALTGKVGPYPDLYKALQKIDTTAPSITMLQPASVVGLSTSVPVGWSALDVSGIGYVDVRRNSAAWNGVPGAWFGWLSSTHASSATYAGTYGRTYCFSGRARDSVGNLSAWSASRCTAVPLRSDHLSYSSGWSRVTNSGLYAGFDRQTKSHGATVTRIGIVAKRISLVMSECAYCGVVQVRWNGSVIANVNTYHATTVHKQVLQVANWSSAHSGTLTLTVTSPTGKAVVNEGLAIYNT